MIWVILLVGLILRLISLDQSLWLDEAINTLAVQNYSLYELITQYATADFHPPGWFILLWFWTKLFGYSEIAVRMPSVIFGVATIYITFLLGQKLVSKQLGTVAAVLLAINPLHIYYSQEARMYSMATLAVALNIWILIKDKKPNIIFLVLSNIFVLASDYVAYFIFPAQLIYLLITKKGDLVKKWAIALASAVLAGFWWLPTFLGQFNVGEIASANLPTWKFVAGSFDFKTLPLTFVKFIIGRISLADKVLYAVVILPVAGLFVYILWKGIKSLSGFPRKLLIVWIVIPLLVATIISLVVPVYNYFRVLFVLPGFIVLVSIGLLSFKKRVRYFFLAAVILIELFCSSIYLFNPSHQREDWKGLVNFLRNEPSPLILFESSGTLPPFDYYAKETLNAKGALRDFPARNGEDVVDLEKIEEEIYLVDYLVEISDPQRLVAKKLATSGYKQVGIKNFTGVGFVYHYVKK